jgi:hypothetical protein
VVTVDNLKVEELPGFLGEKSRFYVKFASMKSSLFLVVACGLGSALNASFTLVFLRFVGQVRYSAAAPLLTVGSIAATAAIGVEYVATIHIVRSGSLTAALRQVFVVLVFGSPLLILAPVVAAFLHIGSSVPVLLATALFVCTFAAAFPSAMLLGYGRLWALGLISILEPVVRLVAFVPFVHHEPIDAAMVISIGVTVVGGVAMALIAIARGPRRPLSIAAKTPIANNQWMGRSIIGLGLLLPFVIPTWMARAHLSVSQAGHVALAAFLAAGALLLVAPVTSAMIPRAAAGEHKSVLNRAALLCLSLAVIAALSCWIVGPIAATHFFGERASVLRDPLTPMVLAVPGWALVGYWIWVKLTDGKGIVRYLFALAIGAVAQVMTALSLHNVVGVTIGPLVSLMFAGAIIVTTSVLERISSPKRRAVQG